MFINILSIIIIKYSEPVCMSSQKKNISPISNLSAFIKKYPNERLHRQFNLLQQSFPSYRAVKGDGNCFYRAFAFLYLASCSSQNYPLTFPKTELNYVREDSRMNSNQYFQQTLYTMWNQYIRQLYSLKDQSVKQNKLECLFNDIPIFDEVIIGYFRSKNYQFMKNSKQSLQPFLRDEANFQKELQRVKTFGAQSQQIQIYSIANALNVKVTVFYVDENTFQPIQYNERFEDKGIYLFFRPGHYDIIYPFYVNETSIEKKDISKMKSLIIPYNTSKRQKSMKEIKNQSIKMEELLNKSKKDQKKQSKKSEKPQNSQKKSQSPVKQENTINFSTKKNFVKNEFKHERKYDYSQQNKKINPVKRKYQPKIIKSFNDPFSRIGIQVLGLTGLFIFSFLVYIYTQ